MCLSRHSLQCFFQTNGVILWQTDKFKYLGVTFSSDGRRDNILDARIEKACICNTEPTLPTGCTEAIAVYKSKTLCF